MKIDFYGDLTCPWSHLGWRRLSASLAQRGLAPMECLRWCPYQLNPDLPAEGIDRADYLLRKFGNAERVRDLIDTIEAAMHSDGLHVNLNRIRTMPNSALAHRLMLLAQEHKKTDALLQEIFIAYFVMGLDIGEPNILRDTAQKVRLPVKRIEEVLSASISASPPASTSAPAPHSELALYEEQANKLGIRAVPFALFNNTYSIAGAHDAIAFGPLIDLCCLDASGR